MDARNGRELFPDAFRRFLLDGLVNRDVTRLDFFKLGAMDRDAFEEKRFEGANAQLAVEAALHGSAMKRIADGDKTHTLVMSHVGIDGDAGLALFGFAREIDGFVETHGTGEAKLFEAANVLDGGSRIHRKSEHRGVRSDDGAFLHASFERERGYAEGAVLVLF